MAQHEIPNEIIPNTPTVIAESSDLPLYDRQRISDSEYLFVDEDSKAHPPMKMGSDVTTPTQVSKK